MVELSSCRQIAAYADITEEQWHELRRGGIGGSDAGVIMGVSKWDSQLSLWAQKTGRLTRVVESEAAEMGTLLEPFIRRELVAPYLREKHGIECDVHDPTHVYESIAHPFMRANVDGFLTGTKPVDSADVDPVDVDYEVVDDFQAGLEIKTGNSYQLREWGGVEGDEIPDSYYWQAQHYMAVTGLTEWYVFGVIGNNRLLRIVPRNDRHILQLIERAAYFWELVGLNDPLYAPMPTGHDADMEALLAMGSPQRDVTMDLSPIMDLLRDYTHYRDNTRQMREETEILKQNVIAAMGDAKYGEGGGYRATFSRFERADFDMDRFRRDHPDLYQEYVSRTESGRLSVREEK